MLSIAAIWMLAMARKKKMVVGAHQWLLWWALWQATIPPLNLHWLLWHALSQVSRRALLAPLPPFRCFQFLLSQHAPALLASLPPLRCLHFLLSLRGKPLLSKHAPALLGSLLFLCGPPLLVALCMF